jgi:hypothetical protein
MSKEDKKFLWSLMPVSGSENAFGLKNSQKG